MFLRKIPAGIFSNLAEHGFRRNSDNGRISDKIIKMLKGFILIEEAKVLEKTCENRKRKLFVVFGDISKLLHIVYFGSYLAHCSTWPFKIYKNVTLLNFYNQKVWLKVVSIVGMRNIRCKHDVYFWKPQSGVQFEVDNWLKE